MSASAAEKKSASAQADIALFSILFLSSTLLFQLSICNHRDEQVRPAERKYFSVGSNFLCKFSFCLARQNAEVKNYFSEVSLRQILTDRSLLFQAALSRQFTLQTRAVFWLTLYVKFIKQCLFSGFVKLKT